MSLVLRGVVLSSTTIVSRPVPDAQQLERLQREYFSTRDEKLGRKLVEAHRHLANALGNRMSRRPSEREDVVQVAMLGLVKAVNRFDPGRGVGFTTFAWRTIEGEIKRYFRDSSWYVHVPRSLQERSLAVGRTAEDLIQELGMSPTASQVAERLNMTADEVVEVLELRHASRPMSIDANSTDDETTTLQLGDEDAGFDRADNRDAVTEMLAILPARERKIVRLRFVEQMSQSDIAARVGLSQMHVSRLLASSLQRLRECERARSAV